MPKRQMTLDPKLAAEAKSLVALAFRNGPIEDVHSGKDCPNCSGKSEYSHITQAEMKIIIGEILSLCVNCGRYFHLMGSLSFMLCGPT